jgi:hypothetical protein
VEATLDLEQVMTSHLQSADLVYLARRVFLVCVFLSYVAIVFLQSSGSASELVLNLVLMGSALGAHIFLRSSRRVLQVAAHCIIFALSLLISWKLTQQSCGYCAANYNSGWNLIQLVLWWSTATLLLGLAGLSLRELVRLLVREK